MLDTVREFPVIVVGGGAAGLSAAAALSRLGIESVVLEQDPELGGTWARRYDRLHLHTVRQFSGLAHFPIPRRYPAYLSRDDVVEYLREYARHFGLRVVTAATVRRIRPRDPSSGRWTVETADGDAWHARVVVIATGQYRQPVLPPWPGRPTGTRRLTWASMCLSSAPATAERRSRPI
jgi:cation diffusion facilitator CzcD-associated flavoprotein CzcO